MYRTDAKEVAAANLSTAVWRARHAHHEYLKTKRHGFIMAATEWKTDRDTFMQRARVLYARGNSNG